MIAKAFQGYDIIGDVHGCSNTLELLLQRLGYSRRDGVYRHRRRQAIFVGDVVDRGPRIREALHLVYDMVEGGAAQMVMGNHEYNALGYTTPGPPGSGHAYLREHNERHNRLIAETLEQFANYPEDWRGFLDWFLTLPLFLEEQVERQSFRVVHACWDATLIETYRERFADNRVDRDFVIASMEKDSFAGQVMDRLTRGTDMRIPGGGVMHSRDGYQRHFFRTKFWAQDPQTYRDVAFQPDPLPDDIADRPISRADRAKLLTYGATEPPLFVGHYWLQGRPRPIRPNIACLDYSAVKYGRLVAYRYDGESQLRTDKFVWVYVDPPQWSQEV
ncbi:serine/threonine protein phosphatase [Exilibacterium tricleocarpae]|uniref:Serine/threonine protein phosphatase n=1 Tax=Exilibacterium tricleocarpae TaxID=2591008 RepID=A0A545TUV0_9GAMM|nr:serine/threonine protein phosphatase [Exilibacterium tricleocarpae]